MKNLLQHRVPKTCCIFHFVTSLGDNYIGIEGYLATFEAKKNGSYLSETGAESTVKCALCTKAVCQTNPNKKKTTCFLRASCL